MTLSHEELMTAIQAKSDQMNAVDLVGGPLTCQILDVKRGSADQPVSIVVDAHQQPWKPSKTALRVLCACWGGDPQVWIGRTVVLYNDEKVKWGGVEVGGIRISHMSDISGPKTIMVNETRGKKGAQKVEPYRAVSSNAQPQQIEKPFYSEESFEENFPKWQDLIGNGDKTAAQIINSIEKRARLTSGQASRINSCGLYQDEPEVVEENEYQDAGDGDPFGEDQ